MLAPQFRVRLEPVDGVVHILQPTQPVFLALGFREGWGFRESWKSERTLRQAKEGS